MKKMIKRPSFLSIALLIVLVLILIGTQIQRKRIAGLEEIVREQKEKIEQMEQQEKIRQQRIEAEQEVEAINKAIVEKFLKTWKKVVGRDAPYEDVVIGNGEMKIYFADGYEATAFIANPEVIARFALDFFLKETGHKAGTVEYYTPLKKKIFSMSGSASGKVTKKKYRKQVEKRESDDRFKNQERE